MPEQQSGRGQPVTKAQFEGAFETILLPFGPARLNLQDDIDTMPPGHFPKLTNLVNEQDGRLIARSGQAAFATGGTEHHSIRKFRDPQAGSESRVWGVDTDLYVATSGALGAAVDTGYSGQPLALVPHRPTLSGDPWMFVGDRNRMRKVRFDGVTTPIGLPAPTVAPTAALLAIRQTNIANFSGGDLQNFVHWTSNAGYLYDADGNIIGTSAVPFITDVTNGLSGSIGLNFETTQGATANGYSNWWGCALTNNLTLVGGVAASDDDYVHIWMNVSHSQYIEEFRIYLVCSAVFDPTIVPGLDPNGAVNTDAYVKAFSANDFYRFIQTMEAQKVAAETARIRDLRDTALGEVLPTDDRTSWADRRAERDPRRTVTHDITAGNDQWGEFGVVGVPLRRGDWQRIGQNPNRSWDTITGIVAFVKVRGGGAQVAVRISDFYLHGGSGPDTGEPGAQQYDWRYTHYDPRTGAESNPSPEMAEADFLDVLRRRVAVTPVAFGDAAIRQRFYRRGGSLTDDWYFLETNSADGATITEDRSDDAIVAAGTLELDHYQPVPTIDDAGTTVLAQPVHALWGPLEGMLFACGDPYRPGHLYFSKPDEPDHWAADGNVEVCAPSEELLNGGIHGTHGFVFSTRSFYVIYPGLTFAGSVTVTPTLCKRGLWAKWAFVSGPGGVYFMAEDGIFRTAGGPEEWLSREIDPLFRGEARHGYLPIDKTAKTAIRLTVWENKLYVQYQDIGGGRQVLVYDLLQEGWRHYNFGRAPSVLQGEDEDLLLLGGLNQGTSYTHDGFSDDGLPITCTVRSRSDSGARREEKLFGDQIVDCDRQGVELTLQNFLNEETVANNTQAIAEGTGRQRHILDSFGIIPQRAHSLSTELFWASASARPVLYQMGTAITWNPEVTSDRVTNWDDLGHPDESWVTGITFDVDTFNQARTIILERDFAGVISTMDTVTVQTNGRHKVKFSWPALPAHQVRVRPSDECKFWVLYRADWIALPEPPRISKWDIHFENAWDQYYTGLDLYCDTLGQEKRLEVYVDETLLTNPFTGLSYFPVVANGRRVVHLTFLAGRGHVFRFKAIDDHVGLLYTHRWHLQEEPSEQANWNQNFTPYGTRADKWLKAIVFECDTFGANKQVRVEADGELVETLTVNADGRKVVQIALTEQALGRVWRMYPADGNPGRLYSSQPVFDEEPFCLDRWETQETNFNLPGWFYLLPSHFVLKSTAPVFLEVRMQVNQTGRIESRSYEIPSTGGEKQRPFVSFQAIKGVLVKFILTSAEAFWLYREETIVNVMPWGGPNPVATHPFGNEGADTPTRSMINVVAAAGRSGGGTS